MKELKIFHPWWTVDAIRVLALVMALALGGAIATSAVQGGLPAAEEILPGLTIDPAIQEAYLKASNTGPADSFGGSVAISGDTVIIGAAWEDSDATGVNGQQTNNSAPESGAAYVFVRSGTTWVQQAYLKASNTEQSDFFGLSVAISGDTVIVGALNGQQINNLAVGSGSAYVFVRSGTTWVQQAHLKASNADANDVFGANVAISGDTVVIGAPNEQSNATGVNGDQTDNSAPYAGAAYVFVRSGTTWSQQAYLKASNTAEFHSFGTSVAISGNTVLVGAPGESLSGAAYVFVRSGLTWSQQAYLKASNSESGDRFGASVAFSGDTAVVGAFGEASNATGVNGDQTNNLAPVSGAAYVFARSGSIWSQQAYLKASYTTVQTPGDLDEFGLRVAISGDTVVVGALLEDSNARGVNGDPTNESSSGAGAAYVFVRDGSTWSQQAYLKASNTEASNPPDFELGGDQFGVGVGVSGGTVVVGAAGESSNATGVNGDQTNNGARHSGATYIFKVAQAVGAVLEIPALGAPGIVLLLLALATAGLLMLRYRPDRGVSGNRS